MVVLTGFNFKFLRTFRHYECLRKNNFLPQTLRTQFRLPYLTCFCRWHKLYVSLMCDQGSISHVYKKGERFHDPCIERIIHQHYLVSLFIIFSVVRGCCWKWPTDVHHSTNHFGILFVPLISTDPSPRVVDVNLNHTLHGRIAFNQTYCNKIHA